MLLIMNVMMQWLTLPSYFQDLLARTIDLTQCFVVIIELQQKTLMSDINFIFCCMMAED